LGQFSRVCSAGILQTRRRPWPGCRRHQHRQLPTHEFKGQYCVRQ
jgi:hypothetical protein